MGTSDNCGIIIFKWLVTILSLAIALPALFDSESKIVFILTACVFIFSQLVDNIEGVSRSQLYFKTVFYVIGSAVGVIAIGLCFYYFAAIFNETKFVTSTNIETIDAVSTDIDNNQNFSNTEAEKLSSNIDMRRYPLFNSASLYDILFFVLMFYFFEETFLGGCELCKYLNTMKKLSSKRNKSLKIVNIDLI